MHRTSILRFQAFCDTYLRAQPSSGVILDVGAKAYGPSETFKEHVPRGWKYLGLDMEAGDNVDLVPAHPYLWDELESGSIDVCITGQTFEHNPVFWVTLAEMARVTKPGGLIFVVAPGAGPVHRYPYDCWRFYPDAWAALAAYLGLELVESEYDEPLFMRVEEGSHWNDSAAVYRRPVLSAQEEKAWLERVLAVSRTARSLSHAKLPQPRLGPAFQRYEQLARRSLPYVVYRRLRKMGNLPRVLHKLFVLT